jgi:epoxyqueuosine reductase QueG
LAIGTTMIVNKIIDLAKAEKIEVFGICNASKMADERVDFRPQDFLPGVKSLICFGIPIPRDIYRSPLYSSEMVWRSQNLLYRRLDTLSLVFSSTIENSGEHALPIFGCMPMGINKRNSVVGYINQIRMAEVTGIGVKGKNGLVIHSHYGSRLMLGGVLTTASLPELHYPDCDETGCPSDCNICSEACPVNAIIPGQKQVKAMRCLNHAAKTPAMSRLKFLFLLMRRNKASAARYMSLTAFDEHTFHICSKCVSLCPYDKKFSGAAGSLVYDL